ncbi:MAG: DUF4976 domain-containing protein [Lacunisphaera sp.]|nr:DUF4976 domain-containing protein [Lacunisphaera sp.]
MEFSSLLPLLHGEPQHGRARIYSAYFGFQRAVVEGNWKLIHYPVAKVSRLFNLAIDPDEMHDRAGDPDQSGRLTALKQMLLEQMKSYDDPLLRGERLLPSSPKEL